MVARPAPDQLTHPLHVAHQAALIGGATGMYLRIVLPIGRLLVTPWNFPNPIHSISFPVYAAICLENSVEKYAYAKTYVTCFIFAFNVCTFPLCNSISHFELYSIPLYKKKVEYQHTTRRPHKHSSSCCPLVCVTHQPHPSL